MGTSCVALSIKNIKTRASREMTSRKKWGERCQGLECGRARYLPSLIALLDVYSLIIPGENIKSTALIQVEIFATTLDLITSPPEGVVRYCFHPVCLCVCVSVCVSGQYFGILFLGY